MISRRSLLTQTLFGAGMLGLRSLATGLPMSLLANPRRALAEGDLGACDEARRNRAQYVIFATSGAGDSINTHAPGTYDDPKIYHSRDPRLAAASLKLGGKAYQAAKPWAALPQPVLDRMGFWHLSTGTVVHPKQPDVMRLMGATVGAEMLPSILAQQLAPCLGTTQAQPINLGAASPSESLSFAGAALPIIPPRALKATLTTTPGPLTDLQALRDQTLAELYDIYRTDATSAQRRYIDDLARTQREVRSIDQALLDALSAIHDDGVESQILAAIALIRMNVAPVISIHVPFSGDNHEDPGLTLETEQTITGVAAIASLMRQLTAADLADRVSFVSLNVFGRTLGPNSENGRSHNGDHQVSITIGKPFRAGVWGGVQRWDADYGAMRIASKTGLGSQDGDIDIDRTLASFGKTVLAAVGVDQETRDAALRFGSVIEPALT